MQYGQLFQHGVYKFQPESHTSIIINMEEEVKTAEQGLPEKTPKQLKKEAEKAAKLAKLAAKKEKLSAVQAAAKPKKDVAEKPKKEEIESKLII